MNIPWLESPICRRTRDHLLQRVETPATGTSRARPNGPSPVLPADSERHLSRCGTCRALAESLPIVAVVARQWSDPVPPPDLARDTALRLAPFWPVRERAVNRQEIRMIWSSGLALAASSLVALLFLLDNLFPILPGGAHHPLVRVGLLFGAAQLVGGSLLSVAVLALDARRRRMIRGASGAAPAGGSSLPSESGDDGSRSPSDDRRSGEASE